MTTHANFFLIFDNPVLDRLILHIFHLVQDVPGRHAADAACASLVLSGSAYPYIRLAAQRRPRVGGDGSALILGAGGPGVPAEPLGGAGAGDAGGPR